jgi:hypothetical protein
MMNVLPFASTMFRPLMCSPAAAEAGGAYIRIEAVRASTATLRTLRTLFMTYLGEREPPDAGARRLATTG